VGRKKEKMTIRVGFALSIGQILIFFNPVDFLANLKGDTEESMDFITAVLQKETPETALLNIQPIGRGHYNLFYIQFFTFQNVQFNVFPSILFPDDASSAPIEAEDHGVSETTLLVNEEEGFALDPVAVTRRPQQLLYCCHFSRAV
jgi:hypothetical protein